MKKLNYLLAVILLMGMQLLYSQIPDPTNLTAVFKQDNHPGMIGYGYVELKWQMPQYLSGQYRFKIFRQGPNDSTFKLIESNWRGLKFNDYNIKPNSTYSYYVVAYNNSGSSNPSNTASITTPPIPDYVRFVTNPPKNAYLDSLYTYDADAVSNLDSAQITYSLVKGPSDASCDSVTGLISWTPTVAGNFEFKLVAQSNLGGKATQKWRVQVNGSTGVITGIVTDESTNQPLKNTKVFFLNTLSSRHEVTYTNSNGQFSKTLMEGSYKIKFYKKGYLPEFYDNKSSIDSADVVTVAANSTVNITAALAQVPPPIFYNISGSVLDSNGLPIRSIVTAFLVKDTTFPITSHHHHGRLTTVTDSLGNYQLNVLGGFKYVVFAKPLIKTYYPEFYDNKRTFAEADKILVNGDVTGINFVLEEKPVYNNGISGLVKDFFTNEPVEAIVSAFKLINTRFKPFKSIRTDSLGNYTIENLEPGNYIVFAKPRLPYLPGYYKADTVAFRWRDADTVVVTENGIVSGININLITNTDTGFAVINGKVRTTLGDPVTGVTIFAIDINGIVVASTNTENDGSYSFENLPGGEYSLIVESTEYENTVDNGTIIVDYGTNSVQSKDLYISPESTTGNVKGNLIPDTYSLMQNYPNPFNPNTTIRFNIPERVFVKLEVYNLIGQKVATLINSELDAGQYDVEFEGTGLSSGIYLYRIEAGNFTSVKKMLLIK